MLPHGETHRLPLSYAVLRTVLIRCLALVLATAGTLVVQPQVAAADPLPCAAETLDEVAAIEMSARCGTPVQVMDLLNATDVVTANPDGTLTLRRAVVPQRVRQADAWVPVDLDIEIGQDGVLRPAASPVAVEFSPGGDAPLVAVGQVGQRLELSWPDTLPVPAIAGNIVTYGEVMPGVDLQLTATVEGYTQVLVVKDHAAASNPALARITSQIAVDGLTMRTGEGGRVEAVDATGQVVYLSDGAYMWDSPSPPSQPDGFGQGEYLGTEQQAGAEPDAPTRIEQMPVELSGDQLSVLPVTDMLTSPDTTFPVYIDPPFTETSGINWTTVRSCSPNNSYWSGFRDVMRVGRDPGNGCKSRAFVNIDITDIPARTTAGIKSASFEALMVHSSPCASPTPEVRLSVTTETWITSASSVTWNNTSDFATYWGWVANTQTPPSANKSACPQADRLVKWSSAYVADTVGWFTSNNRSKITFGIYATDESTSDSWKKFEANTAELVVTYNHVPGTPTNVKATASCASSCSSGATLRDTTPNFQATIPDPDGSGDNGNLTAYFEVWNSGKTAKVTSGSKTGLNPGATTNWTSGTLSNGSTYHLKVRSKDDFDYSSWSSWYTLTINTQAGYTPTNVTAAAGACYSSCASPAMLADTTPTLQAKVTHPYGDTMDVYFEIWQGSTLKTSGSDPSVAHNTTASWTPTVTLSQDIQYKLRVRSKDVYGRYSSWTSYYLFAIDTVKPATPTVTSTLYQPASGGQWTGGIGVPGSFTFGANGSSDVDRYRYTLNGGASQYEYPATPGASVTFDITPTTDLVNTLQVWARDEVGLESNTPATYTFNVKPQPYDVAYWKLDGNTTPAVSQTGTGPDFTGTLQGGATYATSTLNPNAGQAISLDGTDDYLSVPKVLSTDHASGFTVSAWVKADGFSDNTVVAQKGAITSAFRLYYSPSAQQWCFRVQDIDSGAATFHSVCAPGTPQAGVWTHLAGVFNPATETMTIYVDGGPENYFNPGSKAEVSIAGLDMWPASGDFLIGRSYGGNYFDGVIDEVRAYQRPLRESEIRQMAIDCTAGNCPNLPVTDLPERDCIATTAPMCVGEWNLEDGQGTTAGDTSESGNDLTLAGGATWSAGGYNGSTAVMLDGASGYVAADRPVLLTDQSYSLSMWVKPDTLSGEVYLMQQSGTGGSSMILRYRGTTGKWQFTVSSHDGAAIGWHDAAATATPQAGVWTHLAAVYDANAQQIRLYVNGQLAASKNDAVSQPSIASRPLFVGGTDFGNLLDGTIDLVRAFQGALSDAQVADLYGAQQNPGPAPDQKIWWNFDGIFEDQGQQITFDYSPYGNHGLVSGGATLDEDDGQFSPSIAFDGTGRVAAAAPVVDTESSVTYAAWAKPTAFDPAKEQVVLAQGHATGSTVKIFRNPTDGKWCFSVGTPDGQGGTTWAVARSNTPAQLDLWVHLAGTFDHETGQVRLYVNGVLQATTGTGAAGSASTTALTAGAYASGDDLFFTGLIDTVRVFQGVLSPPQVEHLITYGELPA